MVRRLIRATGDDIYGRPADGRDALEITANIRTGHSGAPVMDGSGAVIGVLFSRLRGGGSVAYAVQAGELSRLLEETANKATPTGPCL
jgi:S1-C subfamily serine protease